MTLFGIIIILGYTGSMYRMFENMAYLCSSSEVQDVCERDHQVLSEHKERWVLYQVAFGIGHSRW